MAGSDTGLMSSSRLRGCGRAELVCAQGGNEFQRPIARATDMRALGSGPSGRKDVHRALSILARSSRKIAKGIESFVAPRFLAAGNQPSHRTIARFRLEKLAHFEGPFVEVRRITKLAQGIDEAEDAEFGPEFPGDELPEELRRRKERLKIIGKRSSAWRRSRPRKTRPRGEGNIETRQGVGPSSNGPAVSRKTISRRTSRIPTAGSWGIARRGSSRATTRRSRWMEKSRSRLPQA